MKNFQDAFTDIDDFQTKTFGHTNPLPKIKHLQKEVQELIEEFEKPLESSSEIDMEFADCFILLIGAAVSWGLSHEEVLGVIKKKLDINKTRTWGVPDKDGVVKHVKYK